MHDADDENHASLVIATDAEIGKVENTDAMQLSVDSLEIAAPVFRTHLRSPPQPLPHAEHGESLDSLSDNTRSGQPASSTPNSTLPSSNETCSVLQPHPTSSLGSELPYRGAPDGKITSAEQLSRDARQVEWNGVQGCGQDIADFIDNFLGSDDLITNIPAFPGGMTETPSDDIANVLAGKLPKTEALNVITQCMPQSIDRTLRAIIPPHTQTHTNAKKITKVGPDSSPSRSKQVPSHSVAEKKGEKRKPRTYSQAVPSQHCHICSRRPTEGSPHQVCGNLMKGRCRKTICTKCFHQFRWDLQAARRAAPGTWECPHCVGECPQRAQCVIYNRTSDRRRLKLINHRKRKVAQDSGSKTKRAAPSKRQATNSDGSPTSGRTVTLSVPSMDRRSAPASGNYPLQGRATLSASKRDEETKSGKVLKTGQAQEIPGVDTHQAQGCSHPMARSAAEREGKSFEGDATKTSLPDLPASFFPTPHPCLLQQSRGDDPNFESSSANCLAACLAVSPTTRICRGSLTELDMYRGQSTNPCQREPFLQLSATKAETLKCAQTAQRSPETPKLNVDGSPGLSDTSLRSGDRGPAFSPKTAVLELAGDEPGLVPGVLDIENLLPHADVPQVSLESLAEPCATGEFWLLSELQSHGASDMLDNDRLEGMHDNVLEMINEGASNRNGTPMDELGFLGGTELGEVLK